MVKIDLTELYRILAVLLILTVSAIAAEVDAQLDRDTVTAGNGAMMTLRISGGSANQPVVPPVENLIIQPNGQSQQFQIINGQTTRSTSYTYVVGSHTPGDYHIPPIDIMVDGTKISTRPLKLKVTDAGAASPPAGAPQNAQGSPQNAPAASEGKDQFGFLTVELAANERKHAYVGEIAPVRIKAWLPADSRANLRSGIQPESQAFTLHNVSGQPQQTQEIKDGKRYTVVTWYGGISATKAGKFPASLSVDVTVAIRDTAALKQTRRRTGGPFDDPFFDSVFDQINTPMIQKDITLKSDDQEIEIRPLPTEGRPKGFTGAVGNFKFDSTRIPANWKNGEPQQVSAILSGTGNFALMNAPDLTPSDAWKCYPGKGEFSGGDEASFSGSKSFKFSAVPRMSGAQEAALTFSFFNPSNGTYQTLTSESQKIQVTGEAIIEEKPVTAPEPPRPEKKTADIAEQHLKLSAVRSLAPLVSQPLFQNLLVLAGGLCLIGQLLSWLRQRRDDPARRAAATLEKSTREALELAAICANSGDVEGFFAAARLVLQYRLGALWSKPPQAIALTEIHSKLPSDSPVTRFFIAADRNQYHREGPTGILPEWRTLLDDAIASLNPSTR
ncbi:MAG: BatD family protein [Akkermansiaceae bacterium]|nr:BatD family protein [Akkermansiaceae bacterium]